MGWLVKEMERTWVEVVVAQFKGLFWHLLGGTEYNHKEPQSVLQFFGMIFEPDTLQIWSRSERAVYIPEWGFQTTKNHSKNSRPRENVWLCSPEVSCETIKCESDRRTVQGHRKYGERGWEGQSLHFRSMKWTCHPDTFLLCIKHAVIRTILSNNCFISLYFKCVL